MLVKNTLSWKACLVLTMLCLSACNQPDTESSQWIPEQGTLGLPGELGQIDSTKPLVVTETEPVAPTPEVTAPVEAAVAATTANAPEVTAPAEAAVVPATTSAPEVTAPAEAAVVPVTTSAPEVTTPVEAAVVPATTSTPEVTTPAEAAAVPATTSAPEVTAPAEAAVVPVTTSTPEVMIPAEAAVVPATTSAPEVASPAETPAPASNPTAVIPLEALAPSASQETSPAAPQTKAPEAISPSAFEKCFDSVTANMTALRDKNEELNKCIQSEVHFGLSTNCRGEKVFVAWPQCGALRQEICDLEAKVDSEIKTCRNQVEEVPVIKNEAQVQAPVTTTEPRTLTPDEYLKAMETAKNYLGKMGDIRKLLENPEEFVDSVPGLREGLDKLSQVDAQKSLDKVKEIYEQGRVEWEKNNPLKPYEPQIQQFSKEAAKKAEELQTTSRVKIDEYSILIREYMDQAQREMDKVKDQMLNKISPEIQKTLSDSFGIFSSKEECTKRCEGNFKKLNSICGQNEFSGTILCEKLGTYDQKSCEDRCEKFKSFQ